MAKIVITGGEVLNGEVQISGAKNAVLPILCATLLADRPISIGNVPHLHDVTTTMELLGALGAQLTVDEKLTITVDAGAQLQTVAPYELVKTMRASILVLGPLLAKHGHAEVSLPGGCAIGSRPVDQHIRGLQALGADVVVENGFVKARADRLRGGRYAFDMVTVTGTENVLMAAALARGTTVLENCAEEPEVVDLANCLISMGAKIEGAGASTLTVEGVGRLHPTTHRVVGDRIVGATWGIAAAMTRGDVTVHGVAPAHLQLVLNKLRDTGAVVETFDEGFRVRADARPKAVNVSTLPFPGFPTDLQPMAIGLAAVADGMSLITENVFEARFRFVEEMVRLGADARTDGHHAVIRGVEQLSSAPVWCSDIRAGAGLVLGGLVADGVTDVHDVEHIDRGYPRFEEILRSLGGEIERVSG